MKRVARAVVNALDRRSPAGFGAVVALALLGFQALYLFRAWRAPGIRLIGVEPGSYAQIAANLLTSGRYSLDAVSPTGYRPPLYPLLLAGLMRVAGDRWAVAMVVVQAGLALLSGWLLARLIDGTFRDRLAMLLGVVFLGVDLWWQNEVVIERETVLFSTLVLAFFYVLQRARGVLWGLAALSGLAGLAHLTRPTGGLLMAVTGTAVWAWWRRENTVAHGAATRDWWRRGKGASFAIAALASILPFVLIIAPWQLFLVRSLHAPFLLSSTTAGDSLFKGNNPDLRSLIFQVSLDEYGLWIDEALRQCGARAEDELEADACERARATAWIRDNPGDFVLGAAVKLAAFYSPKPTPFGTARLVRDERGRAKLEDYRPALTPLRPVYTAVMTIILAGALLFLMQTYRRLRPEQRAWVGYVLLYVALLSLTHAVTSARTRYRLPIDPLLILMAATFYASAARRFLAKGAPGGACTSV